MDILEIIVIIFALFAFSRVLLRFKDNAISWRKFLFWTLIWIVLMVVTLLRRKLGFIADLTDIGDPFKVVAILSIIMLFYLVFRLYVQLDKTEQDIFRRVWGLSLLEPRGRSRYSGPERLGFPITRVPSENRGERHQAR